MTERRVLVIDDEVDFLAVVRGLLERGDYQVATAEDGLAGVRAFYEQQPDLVVIDVGLPGLNGWEVLERIRAASDVPILMLTVRGAELDRARGLKAGADDYVAKPFGRQELLARVEALLRRSGGRGRFEESYEDERLSIDFPTSGVRFDGAEIALTPLEFKLLVTFVRRQDEVLGNDRLLELVSADANAVAPDAVRTYVSYLRRKLSLDPPISVLAGGPPGRLGRVPVPQPRRDAWARCGNAKRTGRVQVATGGRSPAGKRPRRPRRAIRPARIGGSRLSPGDPAKAPIETIKGFGYRYRRA